MSCRGHVITVFSMVLLMLPCHSRAAGQEAPDPPHLFVSAGEAYRSGDFASAVRLYEAIVDAGISNGELYYNLGNSFLKNSQVGKAIASYRRAELYMPRDEDLQTNLAYALELTRDRVECRELLPFFKDFCFWYSGLNMNELLAAFLIANAVFWLVVSLRLFAKKEFLTIVFYICLFVTAVLGASAAVKIYNTHAASSGVVIAPEIMVRSGNSVNDTVLFKLHEGAEFEWLQEHAGWIKIRLCDGKKGWVQKQVVEQII